jgi:hypothetical protein
MDALTRMARRLRMAIVLLNDVGRDLRDGALTDRRKHIEQLANSLIAIFELEQAVFAARPDLDYYQTPDGFEPSDAPPSVEHLDGDRRLAAILSQAYALVLTGRAGEASSYLRERLEQEPSDFHKEWLKYELRVIAEEKDG